MGTYFNLYMKRKGNKNKDNKKTTIEMNPVIRTFNITITNRNNGHYLDNYDKLLYPDDRIKRKQRPIRITQGYSVRQLRRSNKIQ